MYMHICHGERCCAFCQWYLSLIVIVSRGAVEADGEQFVEYRGSDSSSSHLQLDQLGFLLKNVSTIVPGKIVPQENLQITFPQVLWMRRGALTKGSSKLDYPIFWLQPQVN